MKRSKAEILEERAIVKQFELEEKQQKAKKALKGCGGCFIAILVLAGIGSLLEDPPDTDAPIGNRSGIRSLSINLSAADVSHLLASDFDLKESTSVDGQPRLLGHTPGKLALLEIIGDPSNIVKASLMTGIVSDRPDLTFVHSAYLMRFAQNVMPTWPDREQWMQDTMDGFLVDPDAARTVVVGDRMLTFRLWKELGSFFIDVKHKDSE